MKIKYYIQNPLKALFKIHLLILRRFRGIWLSLLFRSGKRLSVGKNYSFEILKISFGNNNIIGNNVRIFGKGILSLGDNILIGDNCVICVDDQITIQSDSMIAANCYLTDTNHSTRGSEPFRNQPLRTKKTFIGKNVWIGTNSNILAGSNIGENTVIGAGSTINSIIPKDSFVKPNRELIITPRI